MINAWDRADPLFRFVHARAPEATRPALERLLPRVRTYDGDAPSTFLRALRAAGGSRDEMATLSDRFIGDADRGPFGGVRYVGARASIDGWFWRIDDFLGATRDQPQPYELKEILVGILSNAFRSDNGQVRWNACIDAVDALWRALGDSIIAATISAQATAAAQALLMRAMRIVALLKDVIAAGWLPPPQLAGPAAPAGDEPTAERLNATLVDGLVLLPAELFPLPRAAAAAVALRPAPVAGSAEPASAAAAVGPLPERLRCATACRELSAALRLLGDRPARADGDRMPRCSDAEPHLGADTVALLSAMSGWRDLPLPDAIHRLDRQADEAPGLALAPAEPRSVAALRCLARWRDGPTARRSGPRAAAADADWDASRLTRSPVVGDLLVVKQDLLRYEAGEIADIENVLAKERKLHVHQYKDLQEQEDTVTTEHEVDRTRDSQTTDRQELTQEASRQVQTQVNFGAGASVSGAYGPVQMTASAQFAYANSSTESNRSASTFSKEVVNRSVEVVKDRRLEQRRTLRRQKVLDRNEHELNNDTAQNVVGIYQWVDKVYEAATFNYGRRMMLEVTVPEPAAYLEYAQRLRTAAKVTADPPPALDIVDPATGKTRELRAADIGDLIDVADLAARFRVRGLKQPPPLLVVSSVKLTEETAPAADKKAGDLPVVFTKADQVKVPAHYAPAWFKARVNLLINVGENNFFFSDDGRRKLYSTNIGGPNAADNLPGWPAYSHDITGNNALTVGPFIDAVRPGITNEVAHAFSTLDAGLVTIGDAGDLDQVGALPVALSVLGSPTYTATVTLVSERTPAAYQAWQLEQYEAVVTAWETWKQEFESAVRTAQNTSTGDIGYPASTNPALAATQAGTELRRLFLQMLAVPGVGVGGAMVPADLSDPAHPIPPQLVPDMAAAQGRRIQFVEEAFEWPQLTYLLYPYYWKPTDEWPAALSLDDPNPAFADFLRAGSARVVVPVRPGFEIAVCAHLGIDPTVPWQGGKPPIVDAEGYVSIAEEIKSSQTDLVVPVRVDAPWIVRLPTTLVRLKDDGALPVFREPTPVPAA